MNHHFYLMLAIFKDFKASFYKSTWKIEMKLWMAYLDMLLVLNSFIKIIYYKIYGYFKSLYGMTVHRFKCILSS